MKKKFMIAICVVLVVILAVLGINKIANRETKEGSKTIYVEVFNRDQDKQLFKSEFHTDAIYLSEFLTEAEELEVVMEDSEWGAYITSMLGEEQKQPDGPWWTYDSENNETCIKEGYCPAASSLPISDGDKFVFNLSSNY